MIVIVTAMDKEYDLISEWIAKNWLDYKNVQNIALIKSGIGNSSTGTSYRDNSCNFAGRIRRKKFVLLPRCILRRTECQRASSRYAGSLSF